MAATVCHTLHLPKPCTSHSQSRPSLLRRNVAGMDARIWDRPRPERDRRVATTAANAAAAATNIFVSADRRASSTGVITL